MLLGEMGESARPLPPVVPGRMLGVEPRERPNADADLISDDDARPPWCDCGRMGTPPFRKIIGSCPALVVGRSLGGSWPKVSAKSRREYTLRVSTMLGTIGFAQPTFA